MPEFPTNPLISIHRQAEAETQLYDQTEIVSTFGQPQAEYAAIRKSAALMDLPQRAILELAGKDRLPFLNNLITNQVQDKESKQPIPPGRGVYAFMLEARSGKIIADMNVLERGESTWLGIDARMTETLATALEKYRFAEQVKIVSRINQLHEIAVHGPDARELLSQIADDPGRLESLGKLDSAALKFAGVDVTIWRDDPTGTPGYHIIMSIAEAPRLWTTFIERFAASSDPGKRRLRPIGWAAFNATRIEAGRALFGIDFDSSILPAETGDLLARAISFTKGCYPGQEIVARMHARQQVAKKLVGIRMESDALPIAGAKVHDDKGNEIGGITSSTISPVLSNIALCLGFLKRPHFAVGTTVQIPAEGQMRGGTVVELPFLR